MKPSAGILPVTATGRPESRGRRPLAAPPGPAGFDSAAAVASLPHLPGVYRMLNGAGEVLYVGKALDLKKRVASYFQAAGGGSPRIRLMLGQVAALETTVTRSEAEALLLESNLIKGLTPRYNILFRDDKSYPYLVLSDHRFPRLGFHRGSLDKRHRYFGPFPNAGAVRESIQLLQKAFRIRTCEDSVFSNRSRPCLLHQIRRCTAPCVGRIDESAYAEDVAAAALFLSGKEDEVIERVAARMNTASDRTRYEEAAAFRDQIAALRKVREKQFVSGGGEDADVIAYGRAAGIVCVNLAMIRGGRHLGDKNFYPRNADDCNAEQVLEAFVLQHYLQHGVPPQIVVGAKLEVRPLERLLVERAGHKVHITVNPGGARKAWLEMAVRNAELGAGQALGSLATQEARLTALQQVLELPDSAQRIECFDVSHTMGEAAVASCVVYDKSALQNSEYRRYNIQVRTDDGSPSDFGAIEPRAKSDGKPPFDPGAIEPPVKTDDKSPFDPGAIEPPVKTDDKPPFDPGAIERTQGAVHRAGIAPGDDYAALRDALSRRYRKLVAGEGKMPDLVLIDGGKGQLSVAIDVFEELGLSDVALAAVAKGEARRPGQEQLLVAGRRDAITLGADHPALHLIQQVRDEAHRFAIEGHRARRGKARRSSPLENITGVGVKRRQKLLARFGGLRGLQAASVDELAQVDGISRMLAEKIYHELH